MSFSFGSAPVAGLVIRSGGVELLSLQGKRVAARVSVPFEGRSDLPLVQAIQKAFEQSKVKTRRLAVSILTQDVLFRFFTMPSMPKSDWEGVIQFEIRKYIPFKTEGLVWDYHVMPTAQGKLEVVFAAIQRDTFGGIQSSLASAGVQPVMIEPRSVSLARLVPSGKGQDRFNCVVDVERTSAHLAIVRNGVPYLARDISLAAKNEPAEAGALDARAQRLLSELNVSIDFFTREYASTGGIERVWLFGEEQTVSPWCQPMASHLQCPVELGSALLVPHLDAGLPLTFASAVGLTLAARDRSRVTIDFSKRSEKVVPTAVRRQQAQSMPSQQELLAAVKTPQAAGVVAAMVGLLAVIWFAGSQGVQVQQRRLAALRAPHGMVGYGLAGMAKETLEPVRTNAQTQLTMLEQAMDKRVSMAGKLDALARQAPDGLWLSDVNITDSPNTDGASRMQVSVNGACYLEDANKEMAAIQEYAGHLKQDPGFSEGLRNIRIDEISAAPSQLQAYRVFQLTGATAELN